MLKAAALGASLLLVTCATASAKQFGMLCTMDFAGQRGQLIHFSFDTDAGRYTARSGSQIIRKGGFHVDMGMSLQPTVQGVVLDFPTPPIFQYMSINMRNQVSFKNINGSQTMPGGTCHSDDFKGL